MLFKMNGARFWAIVDSARIPTGPRYSEVEHFNGLSAASGRGPVAEIEEYLNKYQEILVENSTPELAKIAYVLNCGELESDTLEGFLTCFIFQGESIFYGFITSPE